MPGPCRAEGADAFVYPERVGGGARAAITGSRGALKASRVALLLQVKWRYAPQALSDQVRLSNRHFAHRTPLGAPVRQCASNMEMHMGDLLVRGSAVVLPDCNAGRPFRGDDRPRRLPYSSHNRFQLYICQIQNGRSVSDRHNQKVRYATLFPSDKDRTVGSSSKDREWTLPCEVVAESTASGAKREH